MEPPAAEIERETELIGYRERASAQARPRLNQKARNLGRPKPVGGGNAGGAAADDDNFDVIAGHRKGWHSAILWPLRGCLYPYNGEKTIEGAWRRLRWPGD